MVKEFVNAIHCIQSTLIVSNHYLTSQYTFDWIGVGQSELIIIMIKLNSIIRLAFSTIKFPQQYVRTFQLNRQVRSCISLQQLKTFVESHDYEIQLYGKTLILQYLNEFPLNFSFRTIDSPIGVYKYGFMLKGLGLYEQQLRYAIICKISQHVTRDSQQLQRMINAQEQKILTIIKKEPFDIIDALNWILFQRSKMQNQLVQHSLAVICNTPLERSQSIMTKLLNAFLKKIEDLPWKSLRKFNRIFEFICNKYELSIESPKVMVANLEKLVSLKLHMIGYDRIPIAVDQICKKIEADIDKLDLFCLQIIFKSFQSLPTNYNRKLFTRVYKQVLPLINSEQFQLQSLPMNRMTKDQLDHIMALYFKQGFQVRTTVYFINSQNSSYFFSSHVFLTRIEEEFMKPLVQGHHIKAAYTGYFSTGRALLDYYSANEAKIELIYQQLRKVHEQSIKDKQAMKEINMLTSLCGWFNIYSIELQRPFFRQYKQAFVTAFNEAVNRFISKRFSSNWKVKKHYLQIRQVLTKHANSKFPQIQAMILSIIEKDLKFVQQYDSVAYPYYIYLLETAEDSSIFREVLVKIYQDLRGEDAFSFLDNYVRYPKKSTRLNTALMQNLWSLNKDPKMILKMIAGVPSIYFEDGVVGLLAENAVILEDLAVFLGNGDLDHLSKGEIAKILSFCRKFLKNTRIFSQKIMFLTINVAFAKFEQVQMGKNLQVQIQFINQLVQLCIELTSSEQALAIERISTLLQKIQSENKQNSFFMLRLMEVKFLLKKSIPINQPALRQSIYLLAEKYIKQRLEDRSKVMIILLKLHTLREITLNPTMLDSCMAIIKKSIDNELIYPSDLQNLLGSSFVQQCSILKKDGAKQMKEIIKYAFEDMQIQEKEDYYIFYLRLANTLKAQDIIQTCASRIALLPLEPPYVIALCTILKFDTGYYNPILIERIFKDTIRNYGIFGSYLLDILHYINIICYQLPSQYASLYTRMIDSIEKDLEVKVDQIMQENNPDNEKVYQMLTNLYKYYWIAISFGFVSEKTYRMFRMNVRFIKTIRETLNIRKFDGCHIDTIVLIHHHLFRESVPVVEKTPKVKTTFFSPKVVKTEPVPNKQYEEYHQYNQMIKTMQRPQSRNFQLQDQLRKLKIHLYSKISKEENYFTFTEKQKGLQLHYYVKFQGKEYYIFCLKHQMKNRAGLYKGRIRLAERIYKSTLGKEVLMLPQGEFQISFD